MPPLPTAGEDGEDKGKDEDVPSSSFGEENSDEEEETAAGEKADAAVKFAQASPSGEDKGKDEDVPPSSSGEENSDEKAEDTAAGEKADAAVKFAQDTELDEHMAFAGHDVTMPVAVQGAQRAPPQPLRARIALERAERAASQRSAARRSAADDQAASAAEARKLHAASIPARPDIEKGTQALQAELRRLTDENKALRIEMGQERFKVQKLTGLRDEMANAQRREMQARRAEAIAQRDLREAKNNVGRRADFEQNERVEFQQQVKTLERLLAEATDRSMGLQTEIQEALDTKTDAEHLILQANKAAEHWRQDAEKQASKLKAGEQRLLQLEQRSVDDKAKIKALVDQLAASGPPVGKTNGSAKQAPSANPHGSRLRAWGIPLSRCRGRRLISIEAKPRKRSGGDDYLESVVAAKSARHRERLVLALLSLFVATLAAGKLCTS
jgi:hypothetical protein